MTGRNCPPGRRVFFPQSASERFWLIYSATVSSITFTDLALLARRFEVPTEAIVRVLADLCVMDDDVVETIIARCNRLDMNSEVNEAPPARPGRFRELAVKAFQNRGTSIPMLAQYLGIRTAEAMALLRSAISEEEDIVLK